MEKELDTIQKLIDTVMAFFVNYSFQVLGAVIVLIVGNLLANWAAAAIFKLMQKKNLDITLSKFVGGVIKIMVLGFAIIVAMGKFGITIAPFIAFLSAAAFGASFAIRGPLSNYGAGLSIILSRPFVVGNTITVKDVSGVVDEIKLANTRLVTEDGVEITIPNNQIVGEILHNSKQNRIVEAVVGIAYESNPEAAIQIISKILADNPAVTKVPPPQVGIQEFGDSSINIGYRYWIPTTKYFNLMYTINLAVFKALQAGKVSIPFPQRDVRIVSQPSNVS